MEVWGGEGQGFRGSRTAEAQMDVRWEYDGGFLEMENA